MMPMRVKWFFMLLLLAVGTLVAQEERWAVVNVSVCNTRAAADYNAGMETQALLGMPVKVLGEQDEWTRVQTPDGYVSWTLTGCIHPLTPSELSAWNGADQVVVTALYGQAFERPSRKSQPVSDVVAGNRLRLVGMKKNFYHIAYPDGREAFIPKRDACPVERWRKHLDSSPQAILATAHRLVGVPYMWGGTSTKGVDCSGFVQSVLLQHDIIIPRNASDQACTGQRLAIAPDFGNLQPGDLLFFGYKAAGGRPERVLHVAFYLGQRRFIHSLGRVRVASFDPASPQYDAYDHSRLLFAARVLPYINRQPALFTTDKSPFYQ